MRLVMACCFVALAAVPSFAQSDAGFGHGPFWQRPVYLGVAGGVTVPTGQYGQYFNDGWTADANVAWPFTHHHGGWLQANIGYASSSMKPATVAAYGASNGYSSVTSGTLNVVLNKRDFIGSFTPYIVFGGGAYWRVVTLENYAGTSYCNDFIGFCGIYGTSLANRSRTQFVPGADGGGGFRIRLPPFSMFVEARYNTMATRHGDTDLVPVVLGLQL